LIAGDASNITFIPEGQQRKPKGNPSVLANDVGEHFFKRFGIVIVAGRGFSPSDTPTSRKVAVVNESLAKTYYPNLSPIGRTFEAGLHHPYTVQIVGVCTDAKYYRVREAVEPTFYAPYWQKDDGMREATFAIATTMEAQALLPSLRDAMRQVDPNLPMLDVRTQDEQIAANLRQERIFAILTSGFGVLALTLACVGIYGIMAYAVVLRTSEIGVRLALGAIPRQVLEMILREASRMSIAGIALGPHSRLHGSSDRCSTVSRHPIRSPLLAQPCSCSWLLWGRAGFLLDMPHVFSPWRRCGTNDGSYLQSA
jgi:hypothetical protein